MKIEPNKEPSQYRSNKPYENEEVSQIRKELSLQNRVEDLAALFRKVISAEQSS